MEVSMLDIKKLQLKDKIDYLFFSVPLIPFFMIEFAARGSFTGIITWLINEPIQFFISLALFYAVYVFLWANLNHRGAAALSFSIIWIIISCIVGCKREILGTPLMPWDILIGTDAAQIIENVNLSQLNFLYDWVFLLVLAINISIVVIIFIFQKGKYLRVRTCNILTVICCITVATIILTLPRIDMAEASVICEKDGYARGFIVSAKLWSEMNKSVAAMANSPDRDFQYEFKTGKATTDIKPNVIFIMSEAFWDATLLPNVTFSKDPIPNFHALAEESISGKMISNTYGGLTDNVEFEVMTGFSLKYLPYQTNAFMTSVKGSIPALPSYFKSLGYQTISVHPNTDTFFNRNTVYPLLGIDNFVSLEDMHDVKSKGTYISDETFADYIISEYKQGQKPVFMYNISVQNHWPYTIENYYEEYDIEVKSNRDIDKDSMIALQNYTQGIHDADASLKEIIDYFRNIEQPTVIIFFGDHLPALTEELGAYKELGYIDDSLGDSELFHGNEGVEIADERKFIQSKKIFEVPYLIWSNYQTIPEKGKTLSANYFGIYSMSKIGLELPPFYNFLLDYSNKIPVNRYFLSIDENGMPFTETPEVYSDYENIYEKVQANMLFGNQMEGDLFKIKE